MEPIKNYVNGQWVDSKSTEILDVVNPATAEVIGRVPLSTPDEVRTAIQAAKDAFPEWRETPPVNRARYMFRLRDLMEGQFEELSKIIVVEEGKCIDEARGEVRRAIEQVEVAAGIPSLMMGYNLEDIAVGIDEDCVRQPLGVFCAIPPFNFPLMVSLWFAPYALACGNTYIVKPSEQAPLSQEKLFELLDEVHLPEGVINADMVAYDTGTEDQVWITTGDGADSRPLAEACSSMVWAYGLDLLPSITTTMYGASDHLSFSGAGVPAVMVSHADPTSYPYIHSVGDQYRLLNPEFAREVTRLAVAAAAVLAVPVDSGTGGEDFRLRFSGVRPNPFSGAADIRYVVPDGDTHRVIMRLYDVRGRLVRTLVDGDRAPGAHDVRWDGADARGNPVSPGVFFVRLETGGQTTAAKLLRVE